MTMYHKQTLFTKALVSGKKNGGRQFEAALRPRRETFPSLGRSTRATREILGALSVFFLIAECHRAYLPESGSWLLVRGEVTADR